MLRWCRRVAGAGLVAGSMLILIPATSWATVSGGCTVSATTDSGTSTDLTTTAVWHLHTNDVVRGTATYPTQTYMHAYVVLFGVPVTVYNSSGTSTSGKAGPFQVSDYSRFARVFAVGGYSDTCTGAVLIVIDDQNPFLNLAAVVGLVVFGIGLIGLLILFFGGGAGGCGAAFLGAIFGLLFGFGAAMVLAQAGILDPRNVGGIAVIVLGVIIGVGVPMLRMRMGRAAV
jgi:hypothetical protein